MTDRIGSLIDALKQAATERLEEMGTRPILETSDTSYAYDRGYHEGVIDAARQIQEALECRIQ